MPRWLHSIAFTLVVVIAGLAFLIAPIGFVYERNYGLGWLFQLRGPQETPHETLVIGINGRSGSEMGISRYPRDWPRTVHATVLSRLSQAAAAGVVYDFDFSRSRNEEHDEAFAEVVRDTGIALLFERLEGRREALVSSAGTTGWVWREELSAPVPVLSAAARSTAPFPLPKIEKSSFQFWAFKPSLDDTPTLPALAAQMYLLPYEKVWHDALEATGQTGISHYDRLKAPGALRAYMRDLRKRFLADPTLADRVLSAAEALGLEGYEKEAVSILIGLYDGPDERFTNFYGPPGSILTIPYHDVVKAGREVAVGAGALLPTPLPFAERVAGRMAFVGYSDLFEPDQPDRFYTVFTSDQGIDLSGVEIMATAYTNLIRNDAITLPDWTVLLGVTAAFGFIVAQLVFWPPAFIAAPLALIFGGAYAAGAAWLFATESLWLPMVPTLALQLPLAVVAGLLGQYLLERREKMRVGMAIAQYIPEHMVNDITRGRLDASNLNQVVHGVCFATDMSGFSAISESKTPKELAEFINAYFEAIAQVLKAHKVDVTEFHADTIVCAWLGEPDDSVIRQRAMEAALAVISAIERFGDDDPDITLSGRVGLQEGAFYLGNTGGGGRMTYSILGDPANGAARLEGLNKKLKTRVLAAERVTVDQTGLLMRPVGDFTVVGKAEVLPVVEVFAAEAHVTQAQRDLLKRFKIALDLFKSESWAEANQAFRTLADEFPDDGPSGFYSELTGRYVAGDIPAERPTLIAMTSK